MYALVRATVEQLHLAMPVVRSADMTTTEGRLEIVRDLGMPILRTKARRVAKPIYEGGSEDREVDGNARRLAACWNACDGIPTEALGLSDDKSLEALQRAEITTLTDALTEARADNKRLREALEEAADWIHSELCGTAYHGNACAEAQSILKDAPKE